MNMWQLIREIVDEFTDVLKEIIRPRTFFAFMFYGVFCYLIFKGRDIPDVLVSIVNMLMGYWFGSRVGDNGSYKTNEKSD